MKKMRFDVRCVKDCLNNKGVVFTVRKWRAYSENEVVWVDGVGRCLKQRMRKIEGKDDLKNIVKLSGFESVEDWWKAIERFGATNGWLYMVKVLKEHVS